MEISSSAFKDKAKVPIQYVMPGAGGKTFQYPFLHGRVSLLERNPLACIH